MNVLMGRTAYKGQPNQIVARPIGMKLDEGFLWRPKLGVSMKAILCTQYCGPEDLVLTEVPDPGGGNR